MRGARNACMSRCAGATSHGPGGVEMRGNSCRLLRIARVVEQDAELDAAVSVLREARGRSVSRIEVRRRVVRRKEHQRLEEGDDRGLVLRRELDERVATRQGFAAVADD